VVDLPYRLVVLAATTQCTFSLSCDGGMADILTLVWPSQSKIATFLVGPSVGVPPTCRRMLSALIPLRRGIVFPPWLLGDDVRSLLGRWSIHTSCGLSRVLSMDNPVISGGVRPPLWGNPPEAMSMDDPLAGDVYGQPTGGGVHGHPS
jgi:hypothetical protein